MRRHPLPGEAPRALSGHGLRADGVEDGEARRTHARRAVRPQRGHGPCQVPRRVHRHPRARPLGPAVRALVGDHAPADRLPHPAVAAAPHRALAAAPTARIAAAFSAACCRNSARWRLPASSAPAGGMTGPYSRCGRGMRSPGTGSGRAAGTTRHGYPAPALPFYDTTPVTQVRTGELPLTDLTLSGFPDTVTTPGPTTTSTLLRDLVDQLDESHPGAERLAVLSEMRRLVESDIAGEARTMIHRHGSWADVGRVLNCSRQAAWERYRA